jgi:hypothetical protein
MRRAARAQECEMSFGAFAPAGEDAPQAEPRKKEAENEIDGFHKKKAGENGGPLPRHNSHFAGSAAEELADDARDDANRTLQTEHRDNGANSDAHRGNQSRAEASQFARDRGEIPRDRGERRGRETQRSAREREQNLDELEHDISFR